MSVTLSEKLRNFILNNLPDVHDDGNPIFQESGVSYMCFDGFILENADDWMGGINLKYLWKGKVMFTTRVEGARLEGGTSLQLSGIEGRTRIDVTMT